ncbi:hypothetical protein [Virgisporangium aurantiacum]|uniref:Protein kinase domain-containing protein n=1 Tax=Virgisporangium aurantiacum TaxID=175570 RepID=A0A8J4E6L8_9ACTN|nr:hypothetical protein [Virgisporangium aurantiacum]GIJ64225.1 hypothetical protein Vau01_117410 [Virgisporangium aurantiacum]
MNSESHLPPAVGRDELAVDRRLGSGGQGTVWSLSGRHTDFVLKEYRTPRTDTALAEVVAFPAMLAPEPRSWLLDRTVWPLSRVIRDGTTCGVILPPIPERFFGTTRAGRQERQLQYLLYPPNPLWGDIAPLDVDGRIRVAQEAAAVLALLHANGLVVGDLSQLNVLWTPAPVGLLVMDCDDIRPLAHARQAARVETLDWNDPAMSPTGVDPDSDNYKLALLVGRVLARSHRVRPGDPLDLLPGVEPRFAAQITATFAMAAGPSGTRPTAARWLTALGAARP